MEPKPGQERDEHLENDVHWTTGSNRIETFGIEAFLVNRPEDNTSFREWNGLLHCICVCFHVTSGVEELRFFKGRLKIWKGQKEAG